MVDKGLMPLPVAGHGRLGMGRLQRKSNVSIERSSILEQAAMGSPAATAKV